MIAVNYQVTIIGCFLILAIAVQTGFAIKCWTCNSKYDPNCADPFNNVTSELVDCDQRTRVHIDTKAKVCRKIVQKVSFPVYNDYRFIRDCGWITDEKEEGGECIRRAGTFSVIVQYCSCTESGCNTATSLWASTSAVGLTTLAILMWSIAFK